MITASFRKCFKRNFSIVIENDYDRNRSKKRIIMILITKYVLSYTVNDYHISKQYLTEDRT